MRTMLLVCLTTGAVLTQLEGQCMADGSGYSLTVSVGQSPTLGMTKRVSGSWSTPTGDTVSTISFAYSSDGGKTYMTVKIPAGQITGKGGTSGTYYVDLDLPSGTYQGHSTMDTQLGKNIETSDVDFTVP